MIHLISSGLWGNSTGLQKIPVWNFSESTFVKGEYISVKCLFRETNCQVGEYNIMMVTLALWVWSSPCSSYSHSIWIKAVIFNLYTLFLDHLYNTEWYNSNCRVTFLPQKPALHPLHLTWTILSLGELENVYFSQKDFGSMLVVESLGAFGDKTQIALSFPSWPAALG